ncbi:hypothetical protein [Metabacillus sp. RGM 3146]
MVTGFVNQTTCYKELLHEADKALYNAKDLGRYTICYRNACSSI